MAGKDSGSANTRRQITRPIHEIGSGILGAFVGPRLAQEIKGGLILGEEEAAKAAGEEDATGEKQQQTANWLPEWKGEATKERS